MSILGNAVHWTSPPMVALVLLATLQLAWQGCAEEEPQAVTGENNTWHESSESDTVIVFVHGIFSNSRSAWLNTDHNVYWPDLVLDDPIFARPSVFLGGYYTSVTSGSYSIRDAANALYRHLTLPKAPVSEPVLAKQKILFVAHSTGGIVVRHMLVRHAEEFAEKTVGLVLMASPSIGSEDALRFERISDFAGNRMSSELELDNPFLEELDGDFKNLSGGDKLPCLRGVEAIENHLVMSKWLGLARGSTLR